MLSFVLKAVVMYFMALIMIRLLGKRALGELGPFDFVVMTGVGHTVVSVALDKSIPFYEGIVILITLAGLEYVMGYMALKNHKLSDIITGRPVVLIDNGSIIRENLAKEKFNLDDLLQELRRQGIRNIREVDKGILESCGGFSVILKEEMEPVNRRDLGIKEPDDNGIITTELISRAEFFAQEQEKTRPGNDGFSLPEILNDINECLDTISLRMESIEQRLNSRE